jgi:hypothetical protein
LKKWVEHPFPSVQLSSSLALLERVSMWANKQLQRTVMDKVPRHIRRRAAAGLRRYAPPIQLGGDP